MSDTAVETVQGEIVDDEVKAMQAVDHGWEFPEEGEEWSLDHFGDDWVRADPDDNPIDDLKPSLRHISASGKEGAFFEDDKKLFESFVGIIIDRTKPRVAWKPRDASDKLYEELKDFPANTPLCKNNHYDRKRPDLSDTAQINYSLTEEQQAKMRELGAGDCDTCELTKSICRGGRKLLVFIPGFNSGEPVAFQVGGTSIGPVEALLKKAFLQNGEYADVSSRPIRFGWKREKNDKGDTYYTLTCQAGKPLPPEYVQAYQGMRQDFRIRPIPGQKRLGAGSNSGGSPPTESPKSGRNTEEMKEDGTGRLF